MGAQQRAAENNSAWRLYGPPSTAQHRTCSDPIWGRRAMVGMWHRAQPRQCGDTALPTTAPPPAAPRTRRGGSCCWKTSATGRKMGQRCRSVLYFLSGRSAGDMDGSLGVSQPRDRRLNSPGEFCYAKLGARRRTATPNPPPHKTPHPNQHSPGPPRKGGSERGTNRTQRAHSTPESGRENRAPPGPAEPPPPPRTPEGQR